MSAGRDSAALLKTSTAVADLKLRNVLLTEVARSRLDLRASMSTKLRGIVSVSLSPTVAGTSPAERVYAWAGVEELSF